jgi:hypothetical protein
MLRLKLARNVSFAEALRCVMGSAVTYVGVGYVRFALQHFKRAFRIFHCVYCNLGKKRNMFLNSYYQGRFKVMVGPRLSMILGTPSLYSF